MEFHWRVLFRRVDNVNDKTVNTLDMFAMRFINRTIIFRQLLSGGSKTEKFKTHHVKGTIEPYWDKQFVFSNIALNDLRHSILQFSVWDVEKGSSHALLGGARLGLGEGEGAMHDSFGEEVTMWKRILENPNDDIECTISLRSTLDSVKEYVPLLWHMIYSNNTFF